MALDTAVTRVTVEPTDSTQRLFGQKPPEFPKEKPESDGGDEKVLVPE